ncbi:MAG: histidine kinase [Woeseiaceae bacterium]|nr:histidine kinase [Woeseiaceae bacterium]
MLPRSIVKGFSRTRLRNLLVLFFVALAIPTAILIWQAYGQLKWEAFHQYRGDAEELTRRIDQQLNNIVGIADSYAFADYSFLVVTGDPEANFVQRSQLSGYPVTAGPPGVVGFFQVDSTGTLSTPLLPPAGTEVSDLGIGDRELYARQNLAIRIQNILANNALVRFRADDGGLGSVARLEAAAPQARAEEAAPSVATSSVTPESLDEIEAEPEDDRAYDQGVFDELRQRQNEPRKVTGFLEFADVEEKSETLERDLAEEQALGGEADSLVSPGRSKRKEQSALPESVSPAEAEPIQNLAGTAGLRISTFESEIDPLEFSLLDDGHLVFYRKVWRNGERFIQGFIVDQAQFVAEAIGSPFAGTALSAMANLVVTYQGDVIRAFEGTNNYAYSDTGIGFEGELLYRSRLSAPLESLELVFGINRLPAPAGAGVLGWVTLVLAVVLVGGFIALYRLGLGQINLARQQQDFVASVSHELKTPLTSIRMYGEILKEGWADEEKRKQYYDYIHDESERLSRLISNVLQLAKISRNEPQYDMQPIAIGQLMSNTESKIASQVERAGFELRFVNDANDVSISVDEDCFMQIVINLVDNAIKFSRDAAEKVVEVRSKQTADGNVVLSVRDYGPGVPQDQMKKIFELFYRSESELTRETVGTGIGLAIVYQLATAMGGSVDLVNVDPGAEFRVVFKAIS